MNIQNQTTEYPAETSCAICHRNDVGTYVRIELNVSEKQTQVITLCPADAEVLRYTLGVAKEERGGCPHLGCIGFGGHGGTHVFGTHFEQEAQQ